MSEGLNNEAHQALWRLIELINFDDSAMAEKQQTLFDEALADSDDADVVEGQELLWILKDVIDWESGFYVDWKDAESFISCMDELCARLDIELDWGVEDTEDEDFLESTSVPELMELAHEQLRLAGVTLWNWNTEGDAYAGWIARGEDDEEMTTLAETLGLEIRTGDQPY
ncbi:hypothetical protein P3W85_38270 [Cupriavidus basilensis]|uniref:DUF6630 domain-containing protein n=1 Tax=Cupriavidus basilensis TaxID=68895 RepID=A0ABT6B1I1_9BURK|nr:hypothetical protein [Cupriavidus basilensis]MDF3838740.1 hypothetical protein [Cupriavidus basilensis]